MHEAAVESVHERAQKISRLGYVRIAPLVFVGAQLRKGLGEGSFPKYA